MDASHFDRLTKFFGVVGTRRGVLRRLTALLVSGVLSGPPSTGESEATKHPRRNLRQRRYQQREEVQDERTKKKKRCAKAGQPTSKKRKRCCSGLGKDATGRCAARSSGCTPASCGPASCGSVPDGCGGMLSCGGCAGNNLCHGGVCQPCTITCLSGGPETCGDDLQAALDEGGTIYVCPGRYRGGFILNAAATIIGAGQGAGVGSDTILDANDLERVLQINAGVGTVVLERLRLTGGSTSSDDGTGIRHLGTTLHMTDCTVSGNTNASDDGGGIFVHSLSTLEMLRCTVRANHTTNTNTGGGGVATRGTTTLTDCLVEDNTTNNWGGGLWIGGGLTTLAGSTQVRGNEAAFGGGVFAADGGTVEIAETCRVEENSAVIGFNGGGIYNTFTGIVNLHGADPSPIVVNNCLENCAGPGGVSKCSPEPPVSCPP